MKRDCQGRKVGGKARRLRDAKSSQDALASMAADLLVTAAENGQLESALTEVLQDHQTAFHRHRKSSFRCVILRRQKKIRPTV